MNQPLPTSRHQTAKQTRSRMRAARSSRSDARRWALALLVGCVALLAMAPVAAASGTASIKGTVTAVKGGGDLEGIEVRATNEDGESGSATTAANGTYTISALSAGEYTVEFSDPSLVYLTEFESTTLEEGKANTVNAALKESSTLSGKVTSASSGNGIGDVEVFIESEDAEYFNITTTEADGDYSVADLPPGAYEITFSPSAGSSYLSQRATTTLEEGEVKDVSVALKEGGKISGRVTDAITHDGLAKIGVYVYGSSGGGFASTNANGEYTVTGLVGGSYKVEFSWEYSEAEGKECEHAPQCPPKYITQYYNDQPSEATANAVTASEGSTTSGINAAMVPAAPVNTALPAVSGTPAVGSLLSCSNGSWTGESESNLSVGWPLTTPFTYQWLREGGVIAGATSAAYIVQAADLGHGLACEVTATNYAGHASAKSNSLAVPLPVPIVTTSASKLIVSKGATKISIACANAACAGSIKVVGQVVVKARVKKKHGKVKTVSRKQTLVLATGSYSLAAGKTATITLRLTSAGKKALAQAKRHRVSAKLAVAVTGGKQLEKAVQLSEAAKPPKRKAKRK